MQRPRPQSPEWITNLTAQPTDDQRDHLTGAPLPIVRNKLRGWIKEQEAAIEQARSSAAEAREASNLALSLAALQLAMRAQAELIALAAPKKPTVKSRSAAEPESAESGGEEGAVTPSEPSAPEPIDWSKVSDEELERLAGAEPTPTPTTTQSKSSSRPRGRSKGCEPTIAKIVKGRAQERREQEQIERDQAVRPTTAHMLPMPDDWRDE
jgi:hypothetical protein